MPPILTVPHSRPLQVGTLLGRRKRFLADVRLADGRIVVAHCVNPGRMEGLVIPDAEVRVSEADPAAKRTLTHTLELVRAGKHWVGANTTFANRIVEELLRRRLIPGLVRYDELRRECRFGNGSRADFWLRTGRRQRFIEVKNCHLVYPDGRGYFPDSVSARASKHLHELSEMVQAGHDALVLFVVQHTGADAVRPSDLHDPEFARAARLARRAGVRFRALSVHPSPKGYAVQRLIPVDLRRYSLAAIEPYRAANDPYSGSAW
ncbi:MAG: DNA/RNA nuclease SfsA [Polyangiaceae bacterium]